MVSASNGSRTLRADGRTSAPVAPYEASGKRVGKLYIMDDTDSAGGPDSASFIEYDAQLPAPTRYDKIR